MFLRRRPSPREIEAFIATARDMPLSYGPVGLARESPIGFNVDQESARIAHGAAAFEQARAALAGWKHFELGWLELYPGRAGVSVGTTVAILVRHVGFWSLNGCRVLYEIGDGSTGEFGFGYGTLIDHVETGEEIFTVSLHPDTGDVAYTIRAASKPRAPLARLGYPVSRLLQARFRRDSIRAMRRAVEWT